MLINDLTNSPFSFAYRQSEVKQKKKGVDRRTVVGLAARAAGKQEATGVVVVSMDAAVHGYLPTAGMEPVARAAPLLGGDLLELPLLLLRGVVLFPGESLPLRLHSLEYVRLVLTLASQQQRSGRPAHLGVLNTRQLSSSPPQQQPALMELCEGVGTSAELLEVETGDQWSAEEGMAARARGRHRFRIIPPGAPGHGSYACMHACSIHHRSINLPVRPVHPSTHLSTGLTTRQGVLWVRVQILSEDTVPPLAHAYPLARSLRAWGLGRAAARHPTMVGPTYWPPWVWRQLDPFVLMQRAVAVLKSVAAWEGVKGGGLNCHMHAMLG